MLITGSCTNRNPNNPINKAEDQRQKEMVYAAGTIIAGPLLVTPAGQTMLLANGGAGLIGGAVNAGAQGLTNGWSSINYFDAGVAMVTGYYGAASQAALIGRYGTSWLGQTSSLIAATSINTAGTAGSNFIKNDSNYNLPGAIVGTIGAYPAGYYLGSKSPAIGAFSGSAIQETVNWGIVKITSPTQQPTK